MASEWRELALGDFITLHRGFDLPLQDRAAGSVPVVSSSGISGYHSEPRVSGPGVVTGRYGTIGQVYYIKEDFWPLNTTLFVSDFQGNDPLFASYLLWTIDFESCSDKSSVPGVNRNDLHRLRVHVPEVREQRAIAHILGTLDDKIELNRRMNETLETLARALFKSWFVDFDPVRAKAEGRQPVGMDAETAALFPDTFGDSALGPIPEGWTVSALGDVSAYLSRGFQPTYVDEGGVLVLNQRCVRDHRIDFSAGRRHDLRHRAVIGRELHIGDVLINSTGVGTLGRVAQLMRLDEPAVVDSHVTIVRANPQHITSNVLGLALMARESDIEALGEGSTGQTELARDRLKSLPLLIPPLRIQLTFDRLTSPTRGLTSANEQQVESLVALRDALLPKLLSGQVRVRP